MTGDDLMEVALGGAMDQLDTENRVWLLGLGHLTTIPPVREFSEAEVRQVIAMSREFSEFPTGPVRYSQGGYHEHLEPFGYRMVTLSPPSAPHLEMKFGLGIAGFVAVGLTRSGHLDNGDVEPAAVLLSDFESVMADTYTLAVASALLLGYTGTVDVMFTVSAEGPGRMPQFFHLDDETGELRRAPSRIGPMEPVRHQFDLSPETTGKDVHLDLYGIARQLADEVGAGDAQLVSPWDWLSDPEREDRLDVARLRLRDILPPG